MNIFQIFFQNVFRFYDKTNIPSAICKALFIKDKFTQSQLQLCGSYSNKRIIWKKTLVSLLAYIFLISSYFLAFTLAIIYPENRLTLSQFTAVFHTFGAIIMSFYLDPMLSRSIDSASENSNWLENTYSILLGRLLSYFFAIIVLIIILSFK